jgi:hypothetical protein
MTLAEPRRKGDEVSFISTEMYFKTHESRQNEGLKGLKNRIDGFYQKIAFN